MIQRRELYSETIYKMLFTGNESCRRVVGPGLNAGTIDKRIISDISGLREHVYTTFQRLCNTRQANHK